MLCLTSPNLFQAANPRPSCAPASLEHSALALRLNRRTCLLLSCHCNQQALVMMCAGGCTLQWLQHTGQWPADCPGKSPNTHLDQQSHARRDTIHSHHIKHTRRLLRLFRHALSKQTNADSVHQTCANGRHSHDPVLRESAATTETQSTAPAIGDLAAADTSSAHAAASSSAATAESLPARASTRLERAAAAAASHVPTITCCSALTGHTAQSTQTTSEAQTTIHVEATVPDEQLPVNTCHAPCLFSFSFASRALSEPSAADAGADVHLDMDAQRHHAEELVRQHISSLIGSSVNLPDLQTSSSLKVNYPLAASVSDHVHCNMHGENSCSTQCCFVSLLVCPFISAVICLHVASQNQGSQPWYTRKFCLWQVHCHIRPSKKAYPCAVNHHQLCQKVVSFVKGLNCHKVALATSWDRPQLLL